MNKREVFTKAKKLMTEPKNWIRGYYAKNCQGFLVNPSSEQACCFCMLGAVLNALNNDYGSSIPKDLFQPIFNDPSEVIRFNDSATHEQVLAKFDELIEVNS